MSEQEKQEKDEQQVYELGYHLIPTIEEGNLPEIVSKLKACVSAASGSIFAEESPRMTSLAYEIAHSANAKKSIFNKAYFGWIKFEMEARNVAALNIAVKDLKEVLRFLLIKTSKENNTHYHKIMTEKVEDEATDEPKEVEPKKVSSEEIDKSIEDLVIA